VPQPQYMHRGYTMHEMLDEFGLINMNGRCYDPVVGRFLSPDIVVQNPNNTQCYNRYSYAINNPLKYTDPSGWSWSPIAAARHASMMANTLTLQLHDRFQPSIIKSGSSSRGSGFDFGSNAIVFQTTEATIAMELAAINNMLKNVFGMPGLFGNPEEENTHENDPVEDIEGDCQYEPLLINFSNLTINFKPNNTDDNYSHWGAYPLKPNGSTTVSIDAINVGGKVYKVEDGYTYVIVKEDGTIDSSYPLYIPGSVYEVDQSFLYDTMWQKDGKRKNVPAPDEYGGDWVQDRQWWNIFMFPNYQISPYQKR